MVWSFCSFFFSPFWRVCLLQPALKPLPFTNNHLRHCLHFCLPCREAGHPTITHFTHTDTFTTQKWYLQCCDRQTNRSKRFVLGVMITAWLEIFVEYGGF